MPEYELERFSPDTIQKIRSAQAYQDSLEELFIDSPPEWMIIHDINPTGFSLESLAARVRKYIGISFREQFNFRSSDQAFKAWRHAIEEAGIFTFKDSFKDRFLSSEKGDGGNKQYSLRPLSPFFADRRPAPTRHEVLRHYAAYAQSQQERGVPAGVLLRPLLGLFHGVSGARTWRRCLSGGAGLAQVHAAAASLADSTLREAG